MVKPSDNIAGRSWTKDYPIMARAEGIYFYDTNGKRYIDGSGGTSAVTSIGQGVTEVLTAMSAQAQAFVYNSSHAFINQPALDLAKLIAEHAPGEMRHNCKTWFTVTGTDATDDAVRLARQHWVEKGQASKYVTIGRWQAFHGINIGSSGYSGNTIRRMMFMPMFVNSPHIPPAYCYRCPFEKTHPQCNLLCARALETTIRQIGPENVSAFIAEPVVGASLGAVPAPDGYFQVIRDICDRYDVLFIADEVMTGSGRTGRMWGIEHWDVTPDIIATAKGITGGYTPLSAVIARNEVWQPLVNHHSPFRSGHTMNAHVVGCAAGIATLNYILEHNLVENARTVGGYLLTRLKELLDYAIVGDVRGLGMMVGFEIVKDKATKEPFPLTNWTSQVIAGVAQERGLIVYPLFGAADGLAGDMIKLAPPLTTTREQVDEIMTILHDTLQAVQTSLTAT
jgi:adenosylmethionine-8-amino-7-oxononanoate aminotransferase